MIKWNNKVPQKSISRLYNQTVSGIQDDELIDEVGYALYARCESVISATYAFEKKCMFCINCSAEIPLVNNVFSCSCGFNATWDEFKKSFRGKQLYAANALPVFLDYVKKYPKAKTYGEKLICIDILIHSFHIRMSGSKSLKNKDPKKETVKLNRPTGVNIIEGSLTDVILFLDKLSEIDEYSREKKQWRSIVENANGGTILKNRPNVNQGTQASINFSCILKIFVQIYQSYFAEKFSSH